MGFLREDRDLWRAVLKSTQDGSETYLTTLHRVDSQRLRNARRHFSSVRGG